MSHINHKERDAKKVEAMYSTIAARYDLLNHILSLGLDSGWRKKVALETGDRLSQNPRCCTGTGDMASELCRFWKGKVFVEGIDFSHDLLRSPGKKQKKPDWMTK